MLGSSRSPCSARLHTVRFNPGDRARSASTALRPMKPEPPKTRIFNSLTSICSTRAELVPELKDDLILPRQQGADSVEHQPLGEIESG